MHKHLAQTIIKNDAGQLFIKDDWFEKPLPPNIFLDEMAYPDTSYSFTTFYSEKPVAFSLGYASGNYGHGIFTTGINGEINIGKFVVLQCTRIIANLSVTIRDHCMFSWGSVITDSWINPETLSPAVRRKMLERTAHSKNRHLEFTDPKPVIIEENVWIGFEAIILPGVKIGRGAVIGCKTIISENVPAYAVVVGNPSRIIKYLEPNDSQEVREAALKLFINN
jgi:acetyltransferase-like isoleucine patch superfamily enzyme